MLAAEKSKDTFIAPIGIGLVLFAICLADVNYSGASFNPARSLAPCIVAASFPGYHWIHWLGPVLGATLAAGCYHCIKVSAINPISSTSLTCRCSSSSTTRTSMEAKTVLDTATAFTSNRTIRAQFRNQICCSSIVNKLLRQTVATLAPRVSCLYKTTLGKLSSPKFLV